MATPQHSTGGAPGYGRGRDAASRDCGGTERPRGRGRLLMKRAGATALNVMKMQTGQSTGIITEADIARAVADGKNPNDVRILS